MRCRLPQARVVKTEHQQYAAPTAWRPAFPDADALAIIRKGASRIVQVSDDEIGAAIRAYWTDTHNLAEGAGAAALAAALQEKAKLQGKRVGSILSGGNIDFDLFQRWAGDGALRLRPVAARRWL